MRLSTLFKTILTTVILLTKEASCANGWKWYALELKMNEMPDLNMLAELTNDWYLLCLEQNWFDPENTLPKTQVRWEDLERFCSKGVRGNVDGAVIPFDITRILEKPKSRNDLRKLRKYSFVTPDEPESNPQENPEDNRNSFSSLDLGAAAARVGRAFNSINAGRGGNRPKIWGSPAGFKPAFVP